MRRTAWFAVALCLALAACSQETRRRSPRATPRATAASPSPSAAPSPGPDPVPAGFGALSVTWVSEQTGWVLGVVKCPGGRCVAVARTTDGGATWSASPAPLVPPAAGTDALAGRRIRFANARDGWVFDPGLWATHDGGATWAPVVLPGVAQPAQVASLEAAAGQVHAVVLGGPSLLLLSSPAEVERWQPAPVDLPVGAGPVPEAQIVLHGEAGWIVETNRVVVGGARLRRGGWRAWDPPCLDAGGPAVVASSSASDVVAVCSEGMWSGAEVAIRAYASSDGGSSFRRLPGRLPEGSDGEVTRPDEQTIVVAGTTAGGAPLLTATFDSGAGWRTVYRGRSGHVLRELGFTTARRGTAVEVGEDGLGGILLVTRDGGRHWAPARLGAQGAG